MATKASSFETNTPLDGWEAATAATIPELAKLFGVNRRTIHDWRDAGMPLLKTSRGYPVAPCVLWRECVRAVDFLTVITKRSGPGNRETVAEICSLIMGLQSRLTQVENILHRMHEEQSK